jgi:two-component system OmpR family sensor kinase
LLIGLGKRSWSLRARLPAGQMLLLCAVCLGIGAATELALHQVPDPSIGHPTAGIAGAQ